MGRQHSVVGGAWGQHPPAHAWRRNRPNEQLPPCLTRCPASHSLHARLPPTCGTAFSAASISYTSRSATASHCSGVQPASAAAVTPPPLPSAAQLASEDSVNCGAPPSSTRVVFCGSGRAGRGNGAAVGRWVEAVAGSFLPGRRRQQLRRQERAERCPRSGSPPGSPLGSPAAPRTWA